LASNRISNTLRRSRLAPEIIAVKLKQVERVQKHPPVLAPVAQPVEHRQAVVIARYGLAID